MRAGEPGQFGFLKIDKMIDELIIRKTKQIVNLLNNFKIKNFFFFFRIFQIFRVFSAGCFLFSLHRKMEKKQTKKKQTKQKINGTEIRNAFVQPPLFVFIFFSPHGLFWLTFWGCFLF